MCGAEEQLTEASLTTGDARSKLSEAIEGLAVTHDLRDEVKGEGRVYAVSAPIDE